MIIKLGSALIVCLCATSGCVPVKASRMLVPVPVPVPVLFLLPSNRTQPLPGPPVAVDHRLNTLQSKFFQMVEEFEARDIHVEFENGEMMLIDSSKFFCSDLGWVSVIESNMETLTEGGVASASCTGSGWLVWSGKLSELPNSIKETRCGPLVVNWVEKGGKANDASVSLDLPWSCGAWVRSGTK